MGQHGRAASGEEIAVRVSNLLSGEEGLRFIQNARATGGIWVLGGFATLGSRELRNAFDEASF